MLNSKKIDPAKSLSFDGEIRFAASHDLLESWNQCELELRVSWPIIFSTLVLTNSAIEAPYQNRNDAAFGLTAGSSELHHAFYCKKTF